MRMLENIKPCWSKKWIILRDGEKRHLVTLQTWTLNEIYSSVMMERYH